MSGAHPLTAADLAAFLDGFMPLQLAQDDIAGAVVAVVKDTTVIFARGYGYADIARGRPVSPDCTLFRPGSISKLFTWTAVMQQVERGTLDLDRDVNDYIDFRIPASFGRPVTLRDLMTHRPGFEETVKDLFVGSASDLRPMATYLPTHLPRQIFPPGTVPAYSNYGATLAAYIVQRVSHRPFEEYVEQEIMQPLGMHTSTFRQPLPRALEPLMSVGYERASSGGKPFEFIEVAPAGALSATAQDMTRFIMAHLADGHLGNAQILRPATAQMMHARQAGWPAALPAMALGFYEESQHGHRIIGHGGDTDYFHSDLHLILDAGIGFFVSYNSAGKGDVSPRTVLFDRFMDRYFPDTAAAPARVATALADGDRMVGQYEGSRGFRTNVLAITTLLGEVKVSAHHDDTTISMEGATRLNGQPIRFRETSPLVFRAVDGHEQMAFTERKDGPRTLWIDYPFMAFQSVNPLFDGKSTSVPVLAGSIAVMLLTLLGWPVTVMMRRHYGKSLSLSLRDRRLRLGVRVTCILWLAFFGGLAFLLTQLDNPGGLGAAGDLEIHLAQVLGVIAFLCSAIVVGAAIAGWRDRSGWIWSKVWVSLVAIACLKLAWFALHWHMLNPSLRY